MSTHDILMSAAGASSTPVITVADVFSTSLYTGTGSSRSITNNIDLAGQGGYVWLHSRSSSTNPVAYDTVRGATKALSLFYASAQITDANGLTSFNSNGFSLGSGATTNYEINVNGVTYASWTFRKQTKFFTVVPYTGNGTSQTISHDLGVTPGSFFVKGYTRNLINPVIYHKNFNNGTNPEQYGTLFNQNSNITANSTFWNNTAPTSTTFTVGSNIAVNNNGTSYVAYLFADNAGGFGASGTDNVISCGGFTTDSSGNATVTLGYEPQWMMFRISSAIGNFMILDTQRGWGSGADAYLFAAQGAVEATTDYGSPTSTGFTFTGGAASANYIYMTIRKP